MSRQLSTHARITTNSPTTLFFRSWWGWPAVPRRALLLIPYLISPTADRPCLLLPGEAQTKSRPSPSGTCQDRKTGTSSRSWLLLQHWGFPLLSKDVQPARAVRPAPSQSLHHSLSFNIKVLEGLREAIDSPESFQRICTLELCLPLQVTYHALERLL